MSRPPFLAARRRASPAFRSSSRTRLRQHRSELAEPVGGWRLLPDELYPRVGRASVHPDDARYPALRQLAPGLPFSGDGGEPRGSKYRNTRRDTHRRARRIRIADEKEGLPVARSRARLMSDVAWTVAHACRSARPHDGDYFARRYFAQRLPLQRSSQDWWRSPEVCKGRPNAHVGVGLITIAHHEKNLMVLLPSWPACL